MKHSAWDSLPVVWGGTGWWKTGPHDLAEWVQWLLIEWPSSIKRIYFAFPSNLNIFISAPITNSVSLICLFVISILTICHRAWGEVHVIIPFYQHHNLFVRRLCWQIMICLRTFSDLHFWIGIFNSDNCFSWSLRYESPSNVRIDTLQPRSQTQPFNSSIKAGARAAMVEEWAQFVLLYPLTVVEFVSITLLDWRFISKINARVGSWANC